VAVEPHAAKLKQNDNHNSTALRVSVPCVPIKKWKQAMTIRDRLRRAPRNFVLGWLLGGVPLALLVTRRPSRRIDERPPAARRPEGGRQIAPDARRRSRQRSR
jgi:hypothetical protein